MLETRKFVIQETPYFVCSAFSGSGGSCLSEPATGAGVRQPARRHERQLGKGMETSTWSGGITLKVTLGSGINRSRFESRRLGALMPKRTVKPLAKALAVREKI